MLCIYVYTYDDIYIYIYIYVYGYMDIWIYGYASIYIYIYIYTCVVIHRYIIVYGYIRSPRHHFYRQARDAGLVRLHAEHVLRPLTALRSMYVYNYLSLYVYIYIYIYIYADDSRVPARVMSRIWTRQIIRLILGWLCRPLLYYVYMRIRKYMCIHVYT